jgi:hypothetical protein
MFMFSFSKTFLVGLFFISACSLTFVFEARGQERRPMPGMFKQPQRQQQQQQPGMMQRGLTPQQSPQGRQAQTRSHETYNIVEVDNELRIVATSEMKNLKKQLEDEYNKAKKDYLDAKKDKKNKDAKLPEPKKKTLKTVPGKSGIKTQEKAQEELQKLQADRDRGGGNKSKK